MSSIRRPPSNSNIHQVTTQRRTSCNHEQVVVALLLMGSFSIVAQWPARHDSYVYFATNILTACSFVGAGQLVRMTLEETKLCAALTVAGVCWSAQWPGTWNTSIWPLMGVFANGLLTVSIVWGMLNYPGHLAMTRGDRWIMYAVIATSLIYVPFVLSTKAEWEGFSPTVVWPSLFNSWSLRQTLYFKAYFLWVALALVAIGYLGKRLSRMKGIDRLISKPFLLSFVIVGAISTITETDSLFPSTHLTSHYFYIALVLLLLPISVVLVLFRQHIQHSQSAHALYEAFAQTGGSRGEIEAALRKALNDDTLQIVYYDENKPGILPPATTSLTNLGDISDRMGMRLASVFGDGSALKYPGILETSLNASQIALGNAHLHEDIQHQLLEVKSSRTRLAAATLEERKRIGRDLHDGVQQKLLALLTKFSVDRRREVSVRDLNWVTDGLLNVINDVRDLGVGIHPSELRQFGIKTALEAATDGLPVCVDIRTGTMRFDELVEGTVYFLACEAVTNALKHANATKISLRITTSEADIRVEVADNGRGGASNGGRGLNGMRDRVSAVGGHFFVSDDHTGGTLLVASIPLRSEIGRSS